MAEPEWIDRADLAARLAEEVVKLSGDDLAWWLAHRVEPRVVHHERGTHFVVGEAVELLLVFFDDEDEFGILARRNDMPLGGYGLYGDLSDAVRGLRLVANI